MAIAEINSTRIEIHSEYRERELVKQVPGVKWDGDAKVWWTPLSWAACVQLRGVFGNALQVGPALAVWGRNERDGRVNPCLGLRIAEDAPNLEAKHPRLHPFQRAGVQFLATARQALLADEMGLGKTVQAISTLEEIGDTAYPVLIVAPNSMVSVWAKEFATWAPGRRVSVVRGGKQAKIKAIALVRDGEADVAIINWEALRLHSRLAGYGSMNLSDKDKTPKELNEVPFVSIVADEAHKAKDPKSQQTRALWWLGSQVETRFMLTGTPVANSPEDLWSLMRFVSPNEFPAKTKFIDRYALQSWSSYGFMSVTGIKSETKDELFKILDPRFIRRTKAAVLPQLPAKQYSTRYVELVPKQRKAYEQIRKQMVAELEGGTIVATNPLTKMVRLLQFASAHGEVNEAGDLILTEPSCKVDALEEIAAEMGGAKAVVFAESRQLIELAHARLIKLGYKSAMITGAVTTGERSLVVDGFNDGNIQFLLITLGAGGEGLSLRSSSTCIFLQRSFSLVKNLQAEDRLHGLGRGVEGEALEIIDIISEDTAETKVHEARATKADRLEEIVRDADTLREWLSK